MHYIKNRQHGNINIDSTKIKANKNTNKSEFDPNDTTGMTINGKEFEVTKIKGYSKDVVKLTGHLKELEHEAESIEMPKLKQPNIEAPKRKITGYIGNGKEFENTNPDTSSFSLWDALKTKILQIKPAIQQFKQSLSGVGGNTKELELVKYKISEIEEKLEKAKNGEIHLKTKEIIEAEAQLERLNNKKEKLEKGNKGNFFSSLKKVIPSMNNISGMTIKIKNTIKQWGGGLKNGLGHVLKYAGALFSLRGIYSTLSSNASSWLSSQNAQAQQLSANIDYMKYAMGSVFAPVIEYVTNLIYNLMKAVQSLVYAFSGVNIFAKATASSMKSASSSASKDSKSLAGIHNEINNVSDNNGSGGSGSTSPSIDLSQMDNTPNSIADAIKNGNWYEVGATIGQKLNDAMSNIPWDKIQEKTKKIGTGIAQTLNGFIAKTNWEDVGNTFAQGVNTIIYTGYEFVTTFDWNKFGLAMSKAINGVFKNIDWKKAGQTLSNGILGLIDVAKQAISNLDWFEIGEEIGQFIVNIDWGAIVLGLMKNMGQSISGGIQMIVGFGKEIIEGIKKGIGIGISDVGTWLYDGLVKPIIDTFCRLFGIHSPSKVFEEFGKNMIDGLKNGLLNIWEEVSFIFSNLATNIGEKFTEIKINIGKWVENTKENIKNWGNNVKTKISECWTNVSNTVGEKVTTLKNKISTGLNNAKTTVVNWGNNVKTKIGESWLNASNTVKKNVTSLKNNISTGLTNAKTTISNWGNNVKSTFTNLGKKASTWGKDLVSNMANGIKNNISKVTSAVNSVANKIKNFLHFTEPDEGPLSNFHTYMPDMIDLMVKGIRDNTSKVKEEIENLAGTMSYTINTETIAGINPVNSNGETIKVKPQTTLNALEDILSDFNGSNGQPLHVTIQYLGKEIFDETIEYINSKTRRTGKNTIVTVGD